MVFECSHDPVRSTLLDEAYSQEAAASNPARCFESDVHDESVFEIRSIMSNDFS
jgi:hypothetical protein